MLDYNAARRIKPDEALGHAFFQSFGPKSSADTSKIACDGLSWRDSARNATSFEYPSDNNNQAHSLRMTTAQQRREYFRA